MKTNMQICADCGLSEQSAIIKTLLIDGWSHSTIPDPDTVSMIVEGLYRRIEKLESDSDQLSLFRDLRCEKCGHHAHPDEVCAFCENAELVRRIEKLEEEKAAELEENQRKNNVAMDLLQDRIKELEEICGRVLASNMPPRGGR